MAEIMDPDPPAVDPDCDQEGMLAVLLHERDEDLPRVGGYMRGTSGARRAAEERTTRRLWVDPAFGSGPLARVAQDLLSIVVSLAIAAPIAT